MYQVFYCIVLYSLIVATTAHENLLQKQTNRKENTTTTAPCVPENQLLLEVCVCTYIKTLYMCVVCAPVQKCSQMMKFTISSHQSLWNLSVVSHWAWHIVLPLRDLRNHRLQLPDPRRENIPESHSLPFPWKYSEWVSFVTPLMLFEVSVTMWKRRKTHQVTERQRIGRERERFSG